MRDQKSHAFCIFNCLTNTALRGRAAFAVRRSALPGGDKQIGGRGVQVLPLQHGEAGGGDVPLQLLPGVEGHVGHGAGAALPELFDAHPGELLPQAVGGRQEHPLRLQQGADAGKHLLPVFHV